MEAVRSRCVIATGKEIYRGRGDVGRREARIRRKHPPKARHDEGRADEHEDAETYLHDDQRGAQMTAAPRHGARRCRADRGREVEARDVERRREREEQRRAQADRDRRRQHSPVVVGREHERHAATRRKEEPEHVSRQIGNHQPRRRAEDGEDETFGDELPRHAHAARA